MKAENLPCSRRRRPADRFSTSPKTAVGTKVENLPRPRRLRLDGRFSTSPKTAVGTKVENLPCSRRLRLDGRFSASPRTAGGVARACRPAAFFVRLMHSQKNTISAGVECGIPAMSTRGLQSVSVPNVPCPVHMPLIVYSARHSQRQEAWRFFSAPGLTVLSCFAIVCIYSWWRSPVGRTTDSYSVCQWFDPTRHYLAKGILETRDALFVFALAAQAIVPRRRNPFRMKDGPQR